MPRIPTMLRRILRFGFDFLRALSMRLIASPFNNPLGLKGLINRH